MKTTETATGPAGQAAGPVNIPDLRLPEYVLGNAGALGARTALIEADTGRAISYAQLASAVDAAAVWLARAGVRPGDVVALWLPNSIEFVVTWHAASSAGAVITAANPDWADGEIADHLIRTGTRWLVTTARLLEDRVAGPASRAPALAGIFGVGATADSLADDVGRKPLLRRLDPVSQGADRAVDGRASAAAVPAGLGPGDVAYLPTSSGTTGHPKAVVLTHRALVASVCQLVRAQHAGESDVSAVVAPMYAVYGMQVTVNTGLVRGATLVILPDFELGAFLRAVQDHHVTRAEITPAVALLLAKSELVDDYDLSSLRQLTVGAAPLSTGVARACVERLGVRVIQGYGLTEVGGGACYGLDAGPEHPDLVGPPLPGVECRVIDLQTGEDLGTGQQGELLLRSPSLMLGYLGDPGATVAAIDADGWLHTGDIVTADAGGWYRVTGRLKELIKTGGLQVAPAQLEDILLTHPAVADVAVVRSPDEEVGELPKAFIVRAPGAEGVDAEELIAWVAERVAAYKRVRRVEFTSSIPRSPTGKILRRQLAEREFQR